MSEIIRKEHNASTLMYHIVRPAKYRGAVITEEADKKLRETCLGTEARYEVKFLEIGTERDHVHFLVQSVPTYSPEQIVRTIKHNGQENIRSMSRCEEDAMGYYVGTAGEYGNEEAIKNMSGIKGEV